MNEPTPEERLRMEIDAHPRATYVRVEVIDLRATLDQLDAARAATPLRCGECGEPIGDTGGEPVFHQACLGADIERARAASPAAPDDVRLDALDHHAGWCSCRARGWLTDVAPAAPSLAALKDRGWLKHTNGCSWEFRKEDGSKECDCGLIAALRGAATPAAPASCEVHIAYDEDCKACRAATPAAPDHAQHYDPDCEECVYLVRTFVHGPASPAAPEALREALEGTEKTPDPIDGPEQFWYVTGWRERGDALRAALDATPAAPEALREAAQDILRNGSIYHDVGTIRRRLEAALSRTTPDSDAGT